MDTKAYFESLTAELVAVKDRIRNLIGGRYWPGDGQWKESVIRSVLIQTRIENKGQACDYANSLI